MPEENAMSLVNVPTGRLAVVLDGTESLLNVWVALEQFTGVQGAALRMGDERTVILFLNEQADQPLLARAAAMIRGVQMVHHVEKEPSPTFVILSNGAFISCLVCGKTSMNPDDVAWHYCAYCHRFHEDESLEIITSKLGF